MTIFEIFMKYSSWWGFSLRKITNFLRWREFHCLAAPRFIFHVTRRALARRVIRRQWVTWPRLAAMESVRWTISDRKFARFHYFVCSGSIWSVSGVVRASFWSRSRIPVNDLERVRLAHAIFRNVDFAKFHDIWCEALSLGEAFSENRGFNKI